VGKPDAVRVDEKLGLCKNKLEPCGASMTEISKGRIVLYTFRAISLGNCKDDFILALMDKGACAKTNEGLKLRLSAEIASSIAIKFIRNDGIYHYNLNVNFTIEKSCSVKV